tara:strand:+ start:654 stop:1664 length:1011 start_codon:yes stop_codon:yes gene_type:complete
MQTTFQKLLQEQLKQQAKRIGMPSGMLSVATAKSPTMRVQDVDDYSDLLNRPVQFDDILPKPIDTDIEDNTIPDTPMGLLPGPDEDGDGQPDYWYDGELYPDGIPEGGIPSTDRYYQSWIQVTIDGEAQAVLMITTSLVAGGETYNIGYINNQWQLIAEVNGVPVLLPNIWPVSITESGSITWGYQDPTGAFWFTSGNIFSTNPPATWTNPTTGGNVGGDGVDYPQGWSAWIDLQLGEDGPINATGIPLLPGGGDMPPFNPNDPPRDPDGYSVGIGFSIPFPNQTYGNSQAHRDTWNTFVDWYQGLFDSWPPESTWPSGSDWWKDWAESRSGDEPW